MDLLQNQAVFGNSVIFREITSNLPYKDLKDLRFVSCDFNSYVLKYSDFVNRTIFKTCPSSLSILSSNVLQFKPKHISWGHPELNLGTSIFDDTVIQGLQQNLTQVESYFSPTFFYEDSSIFPLQIFRCTKSKLVDLALTEGAWILLSKSYSTSDLEQKLSHLKSLRILENCGHDSKAPAVWNFFTEERFNDTFLKLNLPRLVTFSLRNPCSRFIQLATANAATITSLRLHDIIDGFSMTSLRSMCEEAVLEELKFPNLNKLTIEESTHENLGDIPKSGLIHLIKNHISQLTHLTYFTSVFGIDDELWCSGSSTTSSSSFFKLKEISIVANYIQYTRNTPKFFSKLQHLKSLWLEVPLEPRKPPAGGVHLNIVDVLAMLPATTTKVHLKCIPCESVERRSFRFLLEGFPKPSAEYAAADSLTELKIRFENSQDDDAVLQRVFTHFVRLKQLSLQNLSCCSYLGFTGNSAQTGQPVPRMAGISNFRELVSLSLYGSALTEKMLMDGLKLPKLQNLDLTGNSFSVETYRQLAVQNKMLTELHTDPPPEASKVPLPLIEPDSTTRQLARKRPYSP